MSKIDNNLFWTIFFSVMCALAWYNIILKSCLIIIELLSDKISDIIIEVRDYVKNR